MECADILNRISLSSQALNGRSKPIECEEGSGAFVSVGAVNSEFSKLLRDIAGICYNSHESKLKSDLKHANQAIDDLQAAYDTAIQNYMDTLANISTALEMIDGGECDPAKIREVMA